MANKRIGPQIMFRLLKEQRNRCVYCSRTFNMRLLPTIEHINPVSNGGRNYNNLSLACGRCNSCRGNIDIDLFLAGYFQGCEQPVKVRGPKRWYHGDIIKW